MYQLLREYRYQYHGRHIANVLSYVMLTSECLLNYKVIKQHGENIICIFSRTLILYLSLGHCCKTGFMANVPASLCCFVLLPFFRADPWQGMCVYASNLSSPFSWTFQGFDMLQGDTVYRLRCLQHHWKQIKSLRIYSFSKIIKIIKYIGSVYISM